MDNQNDRDNIDWLAPENRIRATPLDLLRQGINKENWEAVSVCYLMLTGEKLTIPIKPGPSDGQKHETTTTNEVVKRKRGRSKKTEASPEPEPQNFIDNHTPTYVPTQFADCVAPATTKSSNKLYAKASTHDCRPHPNNFVDDSSIAAGEIVKNRKVPDEILNNHRPPMKEVTARCSSCGKVEKLEPGLLPYGFRLTKNYTMSYRCNDCIVGNRTAHFDDVNESNSDDDDLLVD